MTTRPDLDESMRLILMEYPDIRMYDAYKELKELHPDYDFKLSVIASLWEKYRGFEYRRATHDVETGRPLR